ncbi:hypothetical protein PP707_07955 [Acetobacter pasteurianus]|nr:hypothetical protein [Acetobacter pasteurianus]MDC6272220.1 hypothetical protein [Acetobacter pasteurianus]
MKAYESAGKHVKEQVGKEWEYESVVGIGTKSNLFAWHLTTKWA